jgi:hypothetical protein
MKIITYKLEDKFAHINFEEGEELYFGDPCYVVPGWDHDSGNDVWEKLCNTMFHPVTKQHPETGETYTSNEYDFDDKNNIRVVEINTSLVGMSGKFHMWSTNYGDGCYPLTHMGRLIGNLGVDAGCLSLIPMSLIKGWGTEASARRCGTIVDDHSPERRSLLSVEDGDMHWGDFCLPTNCDGGIEDEDTWMNCDEESYV